METRKAQEKKNYTTYGRVHSSAKIEVKWIGTRALVNGDDDVAGIIAFWIFEVKTDGQRRLARPFSQPTHNTPLRSAVAHNLQKYDTNAYGII